MTFNPFVVAFGVLTLAWVCATLELRRVTRLLDQMRRENRPTELTGNILSFPERLRSNGKSECERVRCAAASVQARLDALAEDSDASQTRDHSKHGRRVPGDTSFTGATRGCADYHAQEAANYAEDAEVYLSEGNIAEAALAFDRAQEEEACANGERECSC